MSLNKAPNSSEMAPKVGPGWPQEDPKRPQDDPRGPEDDLGEGSGFVFSSQGSKAGKHRSKN